MPRIVNFNNRQYVEPDVAARMLGSVAFNPVQTQSGHVMLIDTGSGKGFGYGSGISSTLTANPEKAIYEFSTREDAKEALKGGVLWDLMEYLWNPSNNGNGIVKMYYARAATTVAALKQIDFSTGSITVKANSEGTVGNGALQGSILVSGYSMKLRAGVIDSAKFILDFYQGQYRGQDGDGVEYSLAKTDITADTKVVSSIEFSSVNELIAWMDNDFTFNEHFTLTASTASATALVAQDIVDFGAHQLFASGAETYAAERMDEILETIEDLDNEAFLCDDYGKIVTPDGPTIQAGTNKGALSSFNGKILAHMRTAARYTNKTMYVGGGEDASYYDNGTDGSVDIAASYNSEAVVVVHSGIEVVGAPLGSGMKTRQLPALYHAAMVCGRINGLEPQVPGTYKDLRIVGLKHTLKRLQRNDALRKGVLHTRYVNRAIGWAINQSINSLQINDNIVYNDGKSPEISIMRIFHALNKDLVDNGVIYMIGKNQNTMDAEDVIVLTDKVLSGRTAKKGDEEEDNLITSYQEIKTAYVDGKYNTTYCIYPNGPVNGGFFTGYALDPNLKP